MNEATRSSIPHHLEFLPMIFRSDNRAPEQTRPINITPDFISTAEGSALIEVGNTRVICTASVEETVPSFLRNSGKGWISSEYGMLPRATLTRTPQRLHRSSEPRASSLSLHGASQQGQESQWNSGAFSLSNRASFPETAE